MSIIIVNYNVEFYLEQCLNSVNKAIKKIDTEVFVVDNNSIDGSVEMIKRKFPHVKLIENNFNAGFSKANNQAVSQSNSKFILLLNPDTVVEEFTFEKVIDFMESKPKAGACGIRMVDGKGKFLPESKRGLPTPLTSLYYLFGLSKVFRKSKKINRYHLGYLDEFKNHEVDILSGAFMFIKAEAIEKCGMLDETFFMYGEDIDLSYRIKQAGYKNYYFSESTIIHYKGESTKKSSVNYVLVFYKAMAIFAEKHFSKKQAKSLTTLINLGIYFKAATALLSRVIWKSIAPIIDFTLIIFGLYSLTIRWETENIHFPIEVLKFSIPVYAFIWLFCSWINGVYDKEKKISNHIIGIAWGTILILVFYALLPKEMQFSRLFILLGGFWCLLYFLFSRYYYQLFMNGSITFKQKEKTFGVVGDLNELNRVIDLLSEIGYKNSAIYHICSQKTKSDNAIGNIDQLDQISHIYKLNEIIFCAKNNSAKEIISWMSTINNQDIEFKIAQPDSSFLIGSNSINSSGDVYVLNINAISQEDKRRKKRLLDLSFALLFLIFSPALIFLFKRKKQFIFNLFSVLFGSKTFVGYIKSNKKNTARLPHLKNGILTLKNLTTKNNDLITSKLDIIYARDYKLSKDISIIFKYWKNLDQ
ncbi:MAG: glycosyltransferase [Crocinitomicaceae bacterium]|nr:glycosyltransferase [Crocinitomicaceae bacterium]